MLSEAKHLLFRSHEKQILRRSAPQNDTLAVCASRSDPGTTSRALRRGFVHIHVAATNRQGVDQLLAARALLPGRIHKHEWALAQLKDCNICGAAGLQGARLCRKIKNTRRLDRGELDHL